MRPIFMVVLKDGKTDNIFEADFMVGTFKGAKNYSFKDIKDFIVPMEVIHGLVASKKAVNERPEKNENRFKNNDKMMENG